jgi:phasin family protein
MLTADQVLAAHKANIDTLFGLTGKALEGMEKLVELNLTSSKTLLAEAAAQAQSALALKDPQEVLAFQTALYQPLGEKAVSYSREVYDIASATSTEFSKAFEAQVAEAQKKFNDIVESTAQNAPAGSETAVALVKSAVSAANNVFETAQKSVKQAVSLAESNIKAATATTVEATKAPARKRG